MRSARDPQHPLRQKRDPNDREANYRRPIDRWDVIRLSAKALLVGACGVWFKFASDDRANEGAELTLAAGVALVGAGLIDLAYMRSHDIDQMFLNTRPMQSAARWGLVVVGIGLVTAALVAYSR
ncbi:MAG TPA: hypothetical protein VE174_03810 [Actinomycetota bacterium]|nr:hypothetical protein [Actinomycetota bacterium]